MPCTVLTVDVYIRMAASQADVFAAAQVAVHGTEQLSPALGDVLIDAVLEDPGQWSFLLGRISKVCFASP